MKAKKLLEIANSIKQSSIDANTSPLKEILAQIWTCFCYLTIFPTFRGDSSHFLNNFCRILTSHLDAIGYILSFLSHMEKMMILCDSLWSLLS